jgi:hypothetical protein
LLTLQPAIRARGFISAETQQENPQSLPGRAVGSNKAKDRTLLII